MNERGQYGRVHVGQVSPSPATPSTIVVERERSSKVPWIVGAIAVGAAALWARHQSQQIQQLYKAAGLPHQSFTSSLRQDAGSSLKGLAERVRSKRTETKEPKAIETKGETKSEPKSEPKSETHARKRKQGRRP